MPCRTREEALGRYANIIEVDCPECPAKAGRLCDRDGVWIHFGRFQLVDPVTYPWELWPL